MGSHVVQRWKAGGPLDVGIEFDSMSGRRVKPSGPHSVQAGDGNGVASEEGETPLAMARRSCWKRSMIVLALALASKQAVAQPFPASGSRFGSHLPTMAEVATPRHLGYLALGGLATWVAYEVEDASATARTLDRAPFELGGDVGNYYGQAVILAGGTAGLWLAGQLAHDPNLSGGAADLATGLVLDGALVLGMKVAVDRSRPNGGRYSFPSGHTSSAFTVAPILQSRFGWKAGLPAYAMAFATAFGRVEDHWHFPSDTIAGATLGLIVGESVAHHSARGRLPLDALVGPASLELRFHF